MTNKERLRPPRFELAIALHRCLLRVRRSRARMNGYCEFKLRTKRIVGFHEFCGLEARQVSGRKKTVRFRQRATCRRRCPFALRGFPRQRSRGLKFITMANLESVTSAQVLLLQACRRAPLTGGCPEVGERGSLPLEGQSPARALIRYFILPSFFHSPLGCDLSRPLRCVYPK